MEFEPYWLALVATPIFIRAVQTSTRGRYAKAKRGKLMFGAPGLAGLCGVGGLLGLAIAIGGWNQDARTTTTVLGSLLALTGIILWPSTLVLDDDGVSALFVWRPRKRIKYADVVYASRTLGQVHVVGKRDEITHTEHHIDAGRFEAELRRRGVDVWPMLPR